MPGTVLVDPATFTSAISMGAIPREVFGQQGVQDRTKDGLLKWTVGVAVSYAPDAYGITAAAEVLNIGVVSADDPGLSVPAGTPVQFDQLRVGASAPEQRERKDGSGMRVVGGRMFWSARAVIPAAPISYRSKSDAA
jgi:hypothetical protein